MAWSEDPEMLRTSPLPLPANVTVQLAPSQCVKRPGPGPASHTLESEAPQTSRNAPAGAVGSRLHEVGAGPVTVTATVAALAPNWATMVAVPAAEVLTSPVLSTAATVGLVEAQLTTAAGSRFPPSSSTVAE